MSPSYRRPSSHRRQRQPRRLHRPALARPGSLIGAAVLAAVAAVVLTPGVAGAETRTADPALPALSAPTVPAALPVPLPPVPVPSVPVPLSSLLGGGTAPTAASGPGSTTATTPPSSAGLPGLPAVPGLPGSPAAGPTPTSSPTGGTASGAARSPAAAPGVSVGGGVAGAGQGCLSAGGTNGGGLVVMGQDVLRKLTAAVPQTAAFVVPCTTENGLAVDANLVAATLCLRLDPDSSTPLRARVELAGTDVLSQLEAAGLPLDKVLAPCTAAALSTASQPATKGGTAPPAAVTPTRVQAADAANTAARLPYTGADIVPVVLLGLGLVLVGLGLLRGRGRHELGG